MPKMNQEIKEQWVKALRSGKYEQTDGALCRVSENGKERFCCLGVLFDVAGGEVGGEWKHTVKAYTGLGWDAQVGDEVSMDFVPTKFKQFVKLPKKAQRRLIHLNDAEGKSFDEIANWIEKYL